MTAQFRSLLKILEQRRSIRNFQQQSIPKHVIDRLIEAARWAPSAGNRQNFRFLAVARSETIDALAKAVQKEIARIRGCVREDYREQVSRYTANFLHFSKAPLLMVPIRRLGPNLLNALCGHAVVDERLAGEEACCSVSAAIMNLLLAAHTLGLGACWMTGPLIARESMEQLLGIPAGWTLSALIPIGYPDESPPPPKRRDAAQLITYWEQEP